MVSKIYFVIAALLIGGCNPLGLLIFEDVMEGELEILERVNQDLSEPLPPPPPEKKLIRKKRNSYDVSYHEYDPRCVLSVHNSFFGYFFC